MNYRPALVCNLPEIQEPLNTVIASLVEPGSRTAEAYCNSRGWIAHRLPNVWGYAAPADAKGEFYTPRQDLDGLRKNTNQVAGVPNVLLIGDSISIGYTPMVVELLKAKANVQRAKANCGDTKAGLKQLKRWLGETKWEVIHFNWGLHDLCYRHPDSKVYGHRDKVKGTIAVPLEQYRTNLEELVRQLAASGATPIWATTTVVPEGEAGRFAGDEVRYNEIARQIMVEHGIAINDLHALSTTFPPGLSTASGDVHFTKEGYAKLAVQVAEAITKHVSEE